jgi:pyrroline-5-carboxylate reductase
MKIGFIGTGNMGGAIMRGYGKNAATNGDEIIAFSRTRSKLEKVCEDAGAVPSDSMSSLIKESDVVVLAMEPKNIRDNIKAIAEDFTEDKLLISVAAGINIKFFEDNLGAGTMVVRAMPNMPAKVGEGMSSLSRNMKVTDRAFTKAIDIFEGVGKAEEVDEKLIDAVGGVSGSSPAYTYMYIEALAQCAVKNGMEYDQAVRFAAQAVLGAAKMVQSSDESPDDLRKAVCTEGGSTIEGYKKLVEKGFAEDIMEGMQATVNRTIEMAKGK